jgi:hypothetical protein
MAHQTRYVVCTELRHSFTRTAHQHGGKHGQEAESLLLMLINNMQGTTVSTLSITTCVAAFKVQRTLE